MSTSKQSITILGIGNMGSAIAQSFAKANYTVTIWNRTADRSQVKAAISAGAVFEPDLSSALSKSNIIATLLLDYDKIYAVLSGIPTGALSGKTFINIANGTPKQASEMQDYIRKLGAAKYFDSAIMVTPEMVGGPHSFLVISGEDATAFEGIEITLGHIGKSVYLGPAVEAAARYDVAALAAMYGMLSGGYLAMAILKNGGDNVKVQPTVEGSIVPFLTALVPLLGREAANWDTESFDDAAGNSLGMQYLGVKNIVQAAREDGIDAGLLEHLMAVMDRAIKDRGGEGGSSVLGSYLLKH